MELIDGNAVAKAILEEVAEGVKALEGPPPKVVFIRLGEDPASVYYVSKKQRTAAQVGIESDLCALPAETPRDELMARIDTLNADVSVNGILVQSPLPEHIADVDAFNAVAPEKDIDGLHTLNAGKLLQEDPTGFLPCTPSGIVELLARSQVDTQGKHVVVLGRSLLVGKPIAMLLMRKGSPGNATVSVCHSRSTQLTEMTRAADILIAAIGRPRFVTADMVKDGATVIDVGVNKVDHPAAKKGYKLVGDVDFENVAAKVARITPVPGGVGPMTVSMLMRNTLKAAQMQRNLGVPAVSP
ncbi:MAG: bifunctional 5,10-methylenetetrahydrofolate dehydrogenase/5,10-methenyltetrahydrofolate cyclohydrolase [Opitutales bacterium]